MSLGAEDSAFDAGNPPDASEKAKYEEKKTPDLTSFAAFYSFLAQRTLLVLASVDPEQHPTVPGFEPAPPGDTSESARAVYRLR